MENKDDENEVQLFCSHHLVEIDEDYWRENLGTPNQDPKRVLEILVLRSHWSADEEDGIDNFDFTLPGEVTDYVLAVKFTEDGEVGWIAMES